MSSRRDLRRWTAAATLLLLLLALLAFVPVRQELLLDRTTLAADGRSTARVRAVPRSVFGLAAFDLFAAVPTWDVRAAHQLGASAMVAHDGTIVFRAGHRPGMLELALGEQRAQLELYAHATDLDEDGFPDAAELFSREDRAAFTAWFTALAEAQATLIDDAWPAIHHDCAGLVRFAYREALKKHDRAWLERRRYLPKFSAPDVRALNYPELPFLGELPFRADGGRFDPARAIEEQFTAAATAPALYAYNSRSISRDIQETRAGDLLFFSVPHGTGSRMHTMIALGQRPGATDQERATRVVYHTGTEGVRLVTLEELARHPDAAWHPLQHNPRFLGVHRLSLVTHDPASWGVLR